MNSKVYKYFGLILIIISALIGVQTLIVSLMALLSFGGDSSLAVISSLISLIFIIALGLLPGIYYYKFGRSNKKENSLIKAALILNLISIIAIILAFVIIYFLSSSEGSINDPIAAGFLFFGIITIPSIAYLIGLILLIIHWRKSKSEQSTVKPSEKKRK